MVREIKTISDFKKTIIESNTDNLIIVDFFADWCGPCKTISPHIEKLSENYPNIQFYKINVETVDLEKICTACKINSLPTFCYFHKGEYLYETIGANIVEIENKIQHFIKKN